MLKMDMRASVCMCDVCPLVSGPGPHDCPTVCVGTSIWWRPGPYILINTHTDTSTNTPCINSVLRDCNPVCVTTLTEGGRGKTDPGLLLTPRKSVGMCVCMCEREIKDVGVRTTGIRKA